MSVFILFLVTLFFTPCCVFFNHRLCTFISYRVFFLLSALRCFIRRYINAVLFVLLLFLSPIFQVAAKRANKSLESSVPAVIQSGGIPKTAEDKEAFKIACDELLEWVRGGFKPSGPTAIVPSGGW